MENGTFNYLNSRQLPTGRRLFTVKAIRRVALKYGDTDIVDRCDRAIAADEQTLRVELAYREGKSSGSTARGDATEYDQQIDEIWGGIFAIAQGFTRGKGAVAEKASEFLSKVFPDGLAGLTQLPFEEQLADMDSFMERCAPGGDLASHVAAMGLRGHFDQLDSLVPKFAEQLEKQYTPLTFDDVKTARRRGLDRLAGAVFLVLATHGDESPQHAERRAEYLAEFHRQNAILQAAYRRHRTVPDIDPTTGEPLEEESAEAPTEPVN